MERANYHTHTPYCDGQSSFKEMIEAAIGAEMKSLGFSPHAPIPFKADWTMSEEESLLYKAEMSRLKELYRQEITLYRGLEVDYIPVIGNNSEESLYYTPPYKTDYTIGSIHGFTNSDKSLFLRVDGSTKEFKNCIDTLFKGDLNTLIEEYYRGMATMAEREKPDIIGHFDLPKKQNSLSPFFEENDQWYKRSVGESLERIAETEAIMEVNVGGLVRRRTNDFYPSQWILKESLKRKIPIVISTDCHNASQIGGLYDETAATLKQIGFKEQRALVNGKWEERGL